MMSFILSLLHFWLCHPALFYGIAFLLGLFCYLESSITLIFPCFCFWFPFILRVFYNRKLLKHLALSLMTFGTAWIYAAAYYSFPELPSEGVNGKGHIKIHTISLQPYAFGERWFYRCELKEFYPDNHSDSLVSSLPCLIIFPTEQIQRHSRPPANQEYWVHGKLMQTDNGSYLLKVSSKSVWSAIPNSVSWAEQRFQWKKKVMKWIESQFSYPASASFLVGLSTGEFDDFWMRQQFARFGLQHLLAISGFHFAIMAGFLSFILRFFLPLCPRIIILLFCLGAYCFFLNPQASILRAWIMSSFTLLGTLLAKQTTALNSLGLALLIILGYHPLACQELGFQFSFTTTAAILLFYGPAQVGLYQLFPKRTLHDVLQMKSWSQHGYCILAFLRKGIALTLAVNVFALPITLYYFQKFPWMSFLYNLFFPLLASVSLFLLLLAALLSWSPFVSEALYSLNNTYTFFLLQLTYQIPSEIDSYLTIESFHPDWLVFYLCCASIAGILWREKSASFHSSIDFFSFI